MTQWQDDKTLQHSERAWTSLSLKLLVLINRFLLKYEACWKTQVKILFGVEDKFKKKGSWEMTLTRVSSATAVDLLLYWLTLEAYRNTGSSDDQKGLMTKKGQMTRDRTPRWNLLSSNSPNIADDVSILYIHLWNNDTQLVKISLFGNIRERDKNLTGLASELFLIDRWNDQTSELSVPKLMRLK